MKEIRMKITGTYVTDGEPDDPIEFITEGSLYEKGEALYLIYEESELLGMPGSRTRLKITGDAVTMKRFSADGKHKTEMNFKKGKNDKTLYETPYGPFELDIITNKVESTLTAEGTGAVHIDYNMSLKGLVDSRNLLNIQLI